jgi:hypothetical protein
LPKFLRQTFREWALHSIAYSDWAREYYEEQRAKGKRRNTAIRSLAFKWIRILFRCWKERKLYDEAHISARSMHAARKSRFPLNLWSCSGKTLPASAKSNSPRLDREPWMSILHPSDSILIHNQTFWHESVKSQGFGDRVSVLRNAFVPHLFCRFHLVIGEESLQRYWFPKRTVSAIFEGF